LGALGLLFGGCSETDSNAEVVTLVASEEVRLVEVDSMVGGAVRDVGHIQTGETVSVAECRPRKSDIDVIVIYKGQPALLGRGITS